MPKKDFDVIIVGAGASGLASAWNLSKSNFRNSDFFSSQNDRQADTGFSFAKTEIPAAGAWP